MPKLGRISPHLTPSVQRLLDQLDAVPVAVSDAAWNLIAWNRMWAALAGDPSAARGRDRNFLWRHFTGCPSVGLGNGRPARGFAQTFRHPDTGLITLDCDVLTVHDSDRQIVAYSAPPGSEAAEKLKLLSVIGTQVLR